MALLAAFVVLAQAAGPLPESFLPPPDCWTTAGGSPSRSGVTRATAVEAPIDVAWTVEAGGAIEGEALVWDGAVYFCVRKSADQRELRVVDIGSGELLARPLAVRTTLPLAPSVWRGAVVYRSSPQQTAAVRARNGVFRTVWTHDAPDSGAPLASEEGVYVLSGAGLSKHALSRQSRGWSASGSFVGAPALARNELLALEDDRGVRFVARIDASTGERKGRAALGRLTGARDSLAQVAAFPDQCFVRLEAPLEAPQTPFELRVLGLSYLRWFDDRVEVLPWSPALRALPTAACESWIAPLLDRNNAPLLAKLSQSETTSGFLPLATQRTHPALVDLAAPATAAGSLVFVGPAAIDLRSSSIAWRAPLRPSERVTPTRDMILYVDEGKRLVAVRSKAARSDLAVAAAKDLLTPGVLVLRNGAIERGEFRVEATAARITRASGAKGETWRLQDALLLADDDSVIQCGAQPLRGIEVLARHERARALVELADQARSSGDESLLALLIDEAEQAGAPESDLARAQQHLDNSLKSRNKPTPKAQIVAEILERRQRLERADAQVHWRFAQSLLGELRARLFRELARRTLAADPAHPQAREYVRRQLPLPLRPEGDFDALDALELATIAERTPLRVEFPARDGEKPSAQQELLTARAARWRADLLCISSDSIQIVTPVRRLGALARCLAYGELTCTVLESLLGDPSAAPAARPALVIELYESREAYLEASERAFAGGPRGMENTLGHYDQTANVSRFHVGAAGEFDDRLLRIAAHELTHHWLRARAPRWSFRELSNADLRVPGHWVVEGFACLIEQFGFDLELRTWTAGGRASQRLDVVAHAPPTALLPWDEFFRLNYLNFDHYKLEGAPEISLSLQLGAYVEPTAAGLFYAQSEATAHYLFTAQDGALRPKLFEALESYYTGRRGAPTLPELLGVEAKDLGARIQAHAKQALE